MRRKRTARGHYFAYACAAHSSSRKAKRHIRAERERSAVQSLLTYSAYQAIKSAQHRSRIGTSARHSAGDRDMLFYRYMYARLRSACVKICARCTVGKIALRFDITGTVDGNTFAAERYRDRVMKPCLMHYRINGMVSVVSLSGNTEREVYLSRRRDCYALLHQYHRRSVRELENKVLLDLYRVLRTQLLTAEALYTVAASDDRLAVLYLNGMRRTALGTSAAAYA